MEKFGVELILDLHDCNRSSFTRESISRYFERLCDLIDMKREALYFWDDMDVPEEESHKQSSVAVAGAASSSNDADCNCSRKFPETPSVRHE